MPKQSIPNAIDPPFGPDDRFTLGWYRYLQGLGTSPGAKGATGPQGPAGAIGPVGPAGADTANALSMVALGAIDGSIGVTSVALAVPAEFTVAGSPVTDAGTITIGKANESANLVWAGPTTGAAAAPTFRSLVNADMPLTGAGSGTVTSVALTMPAEFSVAGSPVTSSGTFTVTKANETANTVWAGPTTGAAAVPTFRALVGADLPNPSASTLGGIESFAAVSHEWINAISTSGVPSATQPATTDLSDFTARTTFVPTITFVTPGDLSVVYTTQNGAYVKIGPMVLFWITVAFTPTYTTASGNFLVGTLPIVPTDAVGSWGWPVRVFASPTWPASRTQIGATNNTSGTILVQGLGSGVGSVSFATAQIVSGTAYTLTLDGFYF